MKNQALFYWKYKAEKLKCRLLQFLFGALRVNIILCYCIVSTGKFHFKPLLDLIQLQE